MKEFMKKHDIWLRLLAILLAFILWIIARDYNSPHVNYTLTDIPVTIIGADDLLSSSNLTVIEYTSSVDGYTATWIRLPAQRCGTGSR